MKPHYDVICIGSGGAGNTAAAKLASEGRNVLICDSGVYGGTCAITGCDPKKIMITAAEFRDFASKMIKNGIMDKEVNLNWRAMMRHKRKYTENHPKYLTDKYEKQGVEHMSGRAKFTGPNSLKIGDKDFTFGHALIATGSRPFPLPFEGAHHVADNSVFLDLDELPKRLLFIGGGYISVEFANIARAFGSECTIIQADSRLVPAFDADIVEVMTQSLKSRGMNIICGAKVRKIEKTGHDYEVHIEMANGEKITVRTDLAVHGAGRIPNLEGLALEMAGIESGRLGVGVNKFMQTSNRCVYAAGDCADTGGYMLSPVAFMEGYVAAVNILNGNVITPDYADNATVMFNVPSVAAVGHTEESASKAGFDFTVTFKRTENWFTSFRLMEEFSAFKTLVDKKTGLIIGAHLIGPHAEDVINLFALAIKQKIKAKELKKLVFAYPSASADILHMS